MKLYQIFVFLFFIAAGIGCKKQLTDVKPSIIATGSKLTDTADNVSITPIVVNKTVKDTSTKTIVVLGSSTAAGWGASNYDASWVARLNKQLLIDSVKVKFINLSSPGYVTYQSMPTKSVIPAGRPQPDQSRNLTRAMDFNPTLIILNFPTNDIANNYSNEEILSNYAKIVEVMKGKGIEYIITGTQPRNFSSLEQRQRLKELNELLKPIYTNHYNNYLEKLSSSTFTILDEYSAGDGTHLNNKGHNIIFESFMSFPLLNKLLKN